MSLSIPRSIDTGAHTNTNTDVNAHAHAALAPLLPILHGFAHRNTNQHRATHWFSSFAILRRAVRALARALALDRYASAAAARARWMADHVVPRCYLAFTQLAADNQHAPLGLLLLAVLARVNTILSTLLPESPEPLTPTPASSVNQRHATTEAGSAGIDRGVVVRRDDPIGAHESAHQDPDKPLPRRGPKPEAKPTTKKETKKDIKKKKRKKGDELASLFGSLS